MRTIIVCFYDTRVYFFLFVYFMNLLIHQSVGPYGVHTVLHTSDETTYEKKKEILSI